MSTFTLSLLALIPALLLCWYVYAKDRQEKEPAWLLALLFAAGFAIYLPAALSQSGVYALVDRAFCPYVSYSLSGALQYASEGVFAAHCAATALATAVLFECFKFISLFFITFKSKHFSHLFDGVVYATFVSLGFSTMESITFAAVNDWHTLLLRAVVSLPAHMTYGVFMGLCYTLWNTYRTAAAHEKKLADSGLLCVKKPFRPALWLVLSIIGPVLLHAFHAFSDTFGSDFISTLFYITLGALYALAFIVIGRLSRADDKNLEIAHRILMRKYPTLSDSSDAPEKQ